MKSKIIDLHLKLKNKEITTTSLLLETFKVIEQSDLNCFITLDKESAIKKAKELETQEVDNPFFGIPIAIKDNICTKDLRTTCASKMLDEFIPIYDATIIEKLKQRNAIIVGKLNMDEFAMGSNNQNSYYGGVKNPWNKMRVPGGSSGGSAAAIGANLVPLALGTDTGGSIRQPSAFCGVVGIKPTYGLVSRFGVIAFSSSMDQVGPITKNVYDNALLLSAIAGHDEKDMTSTDIKNLNFTSLIGQDVKGMKILYPRTYIQNMIDPEIFDEIDRVVQLLSNNGVTIVDQEINYVEYAIPLYQILAHAEASSNLARFDGVKFGYRTQNYNTLDEMYKLSRTEAFGDEVKRRIMIGTEVLSDSRSEQYYEKALKVRRLLVNSFKEIFKEYDLVITPTTTSVAYDIERKGTVKNYFDDILTIPVNMAGIPALSLPIGFNSEHMPIGLQIIGNYFEESRIYQLASFIENKLDLDLNVHES